MPQSTIPLTPRQKRVQKAERARKLLSGANLRTDSFGEGDESWEWIYQGEDDNSADEDEDQDEEDDKADENAPQTPSKRRKRRAVKKAGRKIIGASRGDFECKIGDTVFLQNDTGKDWVAIVFGFFEDDEGEKSAATLCKYLHGNAKAKTNSMERVCGPCRNEQERPQENGLSPCKK